MRLFFLRHGRADRDQWLGLSDYERPLTGQGIRLMERTAAVIDALGLDLDLILTSPLTRAEQTARIVATRLHMVDRLVQDERLSPGFGPSYLQQMLHQYPGLGSMMLVGHEPDFSHTIGDLIGDARVVCKKGGLARVDLLYGDRLEGELVWLIPPKVLNLGEDME